MANTMVWTPVAASPPDGGRVRTTPGASRIKRARGTTRSAKVRVNLKTNLMMAHERIANMRAWIRRPGVGFDQRFAIAKRHVGTSTLGPVMSIIYYRLGEFIA
jgi:hypothetical protein